MGNILSDDYEIEGHGEEEETSIPLNQDPVIDTIIRNRANEEEDEEGLLHRGGVEFDDRHWMDSKESLEVLSGQVTGYRILQVHENSPSSQANLVSWFDFIVRVNGFFLDQEDGSLVQLISDNNKKPIDMIVFNTKMSRLRKVQIVPDSDWGGEGSLGLTIKFDSFAGSNEEVIHVLEITPNSPCANAGLESNTDYILGTAVHVFQDPEDLSDLVSAVATANEEFEVYIYSSVRDEVRKRKIRPTNSWGNEKYDGTSNEIGGEILNQGYLGCDVGHGYLHQIPLMCRNTPGHDEDFDDASWSSLTPTNVRQLRQGDFPDGPVLNISTTTNTTSDEVDEFENGIQVRTKFGDGILMDEVTDKGFSRVKLDWDLGSGVSVVAKLPCGSVERIERSRSPRSTASSVLSSYTQTSFKPLQTSESLAAISSEVSSSPR